MGMRRRDAALAALLVLAPACGGGSAFSDAEWARLRALSPMPAPPADRTNRWRGVQAAIDLGRDFYADPRFSGPATQVNALGQPSVPARALRGEATGVSCASCHDLGRGGVDVTSVPGNVSSGAGWTDVNALSTVNSAFNQLWFRNGRADSGWALDIAVAESPTTMAGNRLHTAWVIADNYRARWEGLFGTLPMRGTSASPDPRFPLEGKPGSAAWEAMDPMDQNAITGLLVSWAKLIDAYQATLVSGETPFDRFVREGPASDAIPQAAKRGARLFVGKAGCIDCHAGPLLSDGDFHDVGVPQVGPEVPTVEDCVAGSACDCAVGSGCLPWGAWDGLDKLGKNAFRRTSVWSDDPGDVSREAALSRPRSTAAADPLKGAWRTPSLRNVGLTAPYMHDGLYATLAEVVEHYDRGGDAPAFGARAPQVKPLGLTAGERDDLVAFLDTLTESPVAPDAGAPDARPPDAGPPDAGTATTSADLQGAVAIAAGANHTCALISDGTVRCWGTNFHGEAGDGTTSDHTTGAVRVVGLSNVVSIAAGTGHTCAVLADATARCWGRNDAGQLGGPGASYSPLPAPTGPPVTAVAAGNAHSCALMSGAVHCWGANDAGQLSGAGVSGAIALAAGYDFTCALFSGGTVQCWGANYVGQLGNGTLTPTGPPSPVVGLTDAVALGPSIGRHMCAVRAGGTLMCWGANASGQVGDGRTPLPTGVQAVAGGVAHTCAVLAGGAVRCWGADGNGQLGDGSVTGATAIAAGESHTCAVLADGHVACWGYNLNGQLGNGKGGTSAITRAPVIVRVP